MTPALEYYVVHNVAKCCPKIILRLFQMFTEAIFQIELHLLSMVFHGGFQSSSGALKFVGTVLVKLQGSG